MMKIFDSLVNNFGFEKVPGGLGSVSRIWKKEVDVAWYGKQETTYKVVIYPWAEGSAVNVSFVKDGRIEKQKIYSSGYARTMNAIKSTVAHAGFEF